MKSSGWRFCLDVRSQADDDRPFVFTNLRTGEGVERVIRFIIEAGGLASAQSKSSSRA
jgi:Ni2+-binding GTPase involved in maturation of urease and hydrogenase